MKTFEVLLTRSYKVEIDAKDDREALFNAEFFVGGEKDLSNERERAERGFRINEIEMTVNDAIECNEKSNV
jgi:hypothetical protein